VIRARHEPPAVWTPETLRVHLEALLAEKNLRDQQRFDAQEKALADALTAVEKGTQATFQAAKEATLKAEHAAEARYAAMNEFRGQLSDQASTFMPRAEAVGQIAALTARMEAAAAVIAERQERTNQEVDKLASHIDRSVGQRSGMDAGWAYLVGVIGVGATLITVVIAVVLAVSR
jgi:hypothetical protein